MKGSAFYAAMMIGAFMPCASHGQASIGGVGGGHVGSAAAVAPGAAAGLSGARGASTIPSAVQPLISRHTGFPTAREQYVRQAGQDRDAVASCTRRFKSYDALSGTYLGRDGRRHACP
jgi:BA14K-like protein